jgi:nitroimidazol reductase NimA-like FMN-containing flavoprotein (pyridoxamine 5'-phosphate oxidase superfamily)
MLIHEMTQTECHSTLAHSRLGRLACAHANQPYIVPIYFVYEESYLYGFTTPGHLLCCLSPSLCEGWTSCGYHGRLLCDVLRPVRQSV